jgi:hypothetical protein
MERRKKEEGRSKCRRNTNHNQNKTKQKKNFLIRGWDWFIWTNPQRLSMKSPGTEIKDKTFVRIN